MKLTRIYAVMLILTAWLSALVAPAVAATPQQVADAVKKAKDYLLSKQVNGTWEGSEKDPREDQKGGLTAIATYALLASGQSYQDPRMKSAIDWLMKAPITGTYALAMKCQVALFIPQTSEIKEVVKNDFKILFDGMRKQGPTRGFYHYSPKGSGMDHSCSQYGVLGAWACERAGLEVPGQYWKTIDSVWRESQDKSGGWSYDLKASDKRPVTASMTAAGIATLFIAQDYVHAEAGLRCTGNIKDKELELGLDWMVANFSKVGSDPYTLYGIERIGVASGYKYFGTINWYENCANTLVRGQKANGSWESHGSIPGTAFGLLFLVRGGAPVVMNKLIYDQPDPTKPTQRAEASWNQRPRDAANVVRWISKQVERDLNFQVVNLQVNVDELHDAPILFIAGSEALALTPEQEAKLKQFVEQGGLILGHADCGSDKFTRSFTKLGTKLFPAYEFRELPQEHPIYTNEQFMRAKWKNRFSLLSLSNGVREMMMIMPTADPGKAWQLNDDKGREEFFQAAANLFLYAVDKQNLRAKGETYLVKLDPRIKLDRSIKVARLEYNGNWDPEPGGWRRLANVMGNDNKIKLEVEVVKLGTGKLAGYKIAHLTGTNKLSLPAAAADELKAWVNNGGKLVIDAAGGSGEFVQSLDEEMTRLFPDTASELKQTLDLASPIYGSGDKRLSDVDYRAFARRAIGNIRKPMLRGMKLKDQLAVLISREDLSGGLVGQPVDGILGYDPSSASQVMATLLTNLAFPGTDSTKPADAGTSKPADAAGDSSKDAAKK